MKAPQGIIDYDPFVLDEDECEQGRLYVDVDNIATLRIDRRKGHVRSTWQRS